ncbi:MAG: hypothetical protein J0G94_05020 [Sphingomonadales bacterium]|nr:hypothetical protein [Sphingomonadales bacterium]
MVGPALGALILAAGWGPWEIYPAIAAPLLLGVAAMLIFHLSRAGEPAASEAAQEARGGAAAGAH